MPITQEQLDTLQAKLTKLKTDKKEADEATQASNEADIAAANANALAQQAKTTEAVKDGVVNSDVADLVSFVESLVGTPTPTPTPTPEPEPTPTPEPSATHKRRIP